MGRQVKTQFDREFQTRDVPRGTCPWPAASGQWSGTRRDSFRLRQVVFLPPPLVRAGLPGGEVATNPAAIARKTCSTWNISSQPLPPYNVTQSVRTQSNAAQSSASPGVVRAQNMFHVEHLRVPPSPCNQGEGRAALGEGPAMPGPPARKTCSTWNISVFLPRPVIRERAGVRVRRRREGTRAQSMFHVEHLRIPPSPCNQGEGRGEGPPKAGGHPRAKHVPRGTSPYSSLAL